MYTERGEVRCVCPETGTPAAYDLSEVLKADRATQLKYRCPGAARCYRRAGCTAGPYGQIARIPLTHHVRRVFTSTPYGSPSWRRATGAALERVYRRIDHDFGFERHFVRGQARMQTRIGLRIAVMMAAARGHVRAGQPRQMRSLVQPFADTG